MALKKFQFKKSGIEVCIDFTPCEENNQGSQKQVFLDRDGKYAVAIYTTIWGRAACNVDGDALRVRNIVNDVESHKMSEHWREILCLPIDWLMDRERHLCFVMPRIPKLFSGQLVGESCDNLTPWLEDPYFANAYCYATPCGGDFLRHLQACRQLAAGVGLLHKWGWVHTDLSMNNIYISPVEGRAYIIDIDGSVKNDNFGTLANNTVGTSGFVAPEIFKQSVSGGGRILFSAPADLHPLAIHIYALLLHRHPFKGMSRGIEKKWERQPGYENVTSDDLYCSVAPSYIEAKNDLTRQNLKQLKNRYIGCCKKVEQWCHSRQIKLSAMPDNLDLNTMSARRICGPFLDELFTRAFVDGLSNPTERPTSHQIQEAIAKTIALVQVCPNCWHGGANHFVYEGEGPCKCPFCGKATEFSFPFLTFHHFSKRNRKFLRQRFFLTGYDGRGVYQHQVDGTYLEEGAAPTILGAIRRDQSGWLFQNIGCDGLYRFDDTKPDSGSDVVKRGAAVRLQNDSLFYIGCNGDDQWLMSCEIKNGR